jgi:arylsulfatase A-like enzyme
MKAIMVMFDSLNRHMLPSYGCDWVKAPNFARLAWRGPRQKQALDKPHVAAPAEQHERLALRQATMQE